MQARSSYAIPMIWTPTGSPLAVRPIGATVAGSPTKVEMLSQAPASSILCQGIGKMFRPVACAQSPRSGTSRPLNISKASTHDRTSLGRQGGDHLWVSVDPVLVSARASRKPRISRESGNGMTDRRRCFVRLTFPARKLVL